MVLTLLSNGHGEDVIGARLLESLRSRLPGYAFQAFPTVDRGEAYEPLGVPILGPRQVMPSGGFLLHHPRLFADDLRAGFLGMTWRQGTALRALETDVLVTVGDIYALFLSRLVRARRRFAVQPLISAHHAAGRSSLSSLARPARHFMERFSAAEKRLLRAVEQVYVRDAPTARLLQEAGLGNVSALGNPMLDALSGAAPLLGLDLGPPVVALLPGSRAHAPRALALMLQALEHWPQATGLVAWAGGTLPANWPPGWTFRAMPVQEGPVREEGEVGRLERGEGRVYLLRGRFADVLASSDLVLGTAGTANEQAASLGLPVLAFAVPPLYTASYLRNQRRLLGRALSLAAPEPAAIATVLRSLWEDQERYEQAAADGRERMGRPGGAQAIAADLVKRLG